MGIELNLTGTVEEKVVIVGGQRVQLLVQPVQMVDQILHTKSVCAGKKQWKNWQTIWKTIR